LERLIYQIYSELIIQMSDQNVDQPVVSTQNVSLNLVEAETEIAASTEAAPASTVEADGETESLASDTSDGSEFETVDLAQSELYQVLNLFLSRSPEEGQDDDEPTENVADVLSGLRDSVDNLTSVLQKAVVAFSAASAATAQQKSSSSSSLRRHRTKH